MSAIADIIKAHSELAWEASTGKAFCDCGAYLCKSEVPIVQQHNKLYKHAADEVAKAGYSKEAV